MKVKTKRYKGHNILYEFIYLKMRALYICAGSLCIWVTSFNNASMERNQTARDLQLKAVQGHIQRFWNRATSSLCILRNPPYLSIYLSLDSDLSIYLSLDSDLSIYLSLDSDLSICLSLDSDLSIYLSLDSDLSIYLSLDSDLSIYLSITWFWSIYLSIHSSIFIAISVSSNVCILYWAL